MSIISNLRQGSETKLAKVLLFILTASFVFWGVSGQLISGSNTAVTIGGKQISIQEVDRELRRQIEQMRSITGQNFDYKQAVRMGFLEQVINNIVWREVLDQRSKSLGVLPSDGRIFNEIKNYKEFKDDKGNFSPESFAYILSQNGVSEKEFVASISAEMSRQLLTGALAGTANPSFLAEIVAAKKHETRTFDMVSINPAAEKITTAPTDEELKKIYDSHLDSFQVPELRKISVITVSGADYKKMLETAEAIIDEKNGGADNTAIARNFKVVIEPAVTIDSESKALAPRLRDIAFFALDEGGISDPQDSGNTIKLVIVDKVIPAAPKPFATVKPEISKLFASQKQQEQAAAKQADIFAKLNEGLTLPQAVIAVDKTLPFRPQVKLNAEGGSLPPEVAGRVFLNDKDKPFLAQDDVGLLYIIVVKGASLPASTITAADTKTADGIIRNAILDDYIAYLVSQGGVKQNASALARFAQ